MSDWRDISTAPKDGTSVLLYLGDSIPDTPYVRVGSYLSRKDADELGEDVDMAGGWNIWHEDGADWYVIDFHEPHAWAPLPDRRPAPPVLEPEKA